MQYRAHFICTWAAFALFATHHCEIPPIHLPDDHENGNIPEPTSPATYGCTLTQGYWRNHEWPVSSLMLGGVTYDEEQLRRILTTPPRGDASLILAHQLIAALLNVASGASSTPAIADAQAWMAANGTELAFGIRSSSESGSVAVALASELADYNEGRTGPGHCDDGPGDGGGSTPEPSDPPTEGPSGPF